LLYKKLQSLENPSKNQRIWIIAHRGGSGEMPENTLKAFNHSKSFSMLEMDLHPTKDNIITVAHDNLLDRLSGLQSSVTETNFKDLPPYKRSFFSHFLEKPFESDEFHRYSSLEEVFENCQNAVICADLKTVNESSIKELKRLIEKYDRKNLTVFYKQILGNAGIKNSRAIQREIKGGIYFMPMMTVILIYLSYLIGVIGLIPIRESIMAVPIMTSQFTLLKKSEMGAFRAYL
jgi:hypothetical protein